MQARFQAALQHVALCFGNHSDNREKQFNGLKERLLERGYPAIVIDTAKNRARKVPRKVALRKTKPAQSEDPKFAVTYDPRLPSLGNIMASTGDKWLPGTNT